MVGRCGVVKRACFAQAAVALSMRRACVVKWIERFMISSGRQIPALLVAGCCAWWPAVCLDAAVEEAIMEGRKAGGKGACQLRD
jgi:hypothetical protein